MFERRVELVPLLLFVIAVLTAFLFYDHETAQQREEIVERQRDFEARTVAQVKQLDTKATEQRLQAEADVRTHELELKKLELEIKRAEADRALALAQQKELETQAAAQKRAADTAEAAAERARMDAETQREENRQQEARKHAAEVRTATQERMDAARRFNDLAWKKQTAERRVIAWRNKLECAQHSKDKAAMDLANAQGVPVRASSSNPPQHRRYDPLEGLDPAQSDPADDVASPRSRRSGGAGNGPTVTWITSNREALESAQEQQAGAEHAIADAQQQLAKAQQDLAQLATAYESALGAKESADRRCAQLAPPRAGNRVFATYAMLDGRKLEAFCVIESGDDIWLKTGAGIEAIKRADVEEVVRADEQGK